MFHVIMKLHQALMASDIDMSFSEYYSNFGLMVKKRDVDLVHGLIILLGGSPGTFPPHNPPTGAVEAHKALTSKITKAQKIPKNKAIEGVCEEDSWMKN